MKILFTISMLELFMGGGGRLLEVGPVTVRMILFAAFLCMGFIVVIRRPPKGFAVPLAIGLVGAYLLVYVAALLIGSLKGNDLGIMMGDMKQSLYWLAAPFLALVLRSRDMVLRTATLIRIAGVVLAVGYIGVVAALVLGIIHYPSLYTTLSATGEFAFRSNMFFFYKGFLYLCISAIFFLAIPKRFSAVWATVIILALGMTLTRGFVLSTCFAALLMLIVQHRWRHMGVALAAVVCVLFFVFVYMPSHDETIALSRDTSNNQRIEDFTYIVDNIKVESLLLGEGLGTLINGRVNIENTFLWAIWRLGIAGFLFWLLPLVLCLNYFAKISRHSPDFRLACAYFFSTVVVYVQTMSNPYLNNPIGLSFVVVAIFSLRTLSKLAPAPAPVCSCHVALASVVLTDQRTTP
jgi:hypothetical protein